MNPEIIQLQERVKALEDLLTRKGVSNDFAETIRDIVFVSFDTQTATTRSASTSGGQTVTVIKNPTKWVKAYAKGQIGFIPFYINP